MQSRKGRRVYLRFRDEKLELGRANGKLKRVSCCLSFSHTEEGLKLSEV